VSLPVRREALAAIADAAAALARTAAAAPLGAVQKADLSPVTAVDLAVNAFLDRELKALLPGSAWLSEESEDDLGRLAARFVWIVDPIDGTKQLVAGIPEVAISIGLVAAGRVVAAAVANPMTGESGVWVDDAPPLFSGLERRPLPPSLETATAIVSRSEAAEGALVGVKSVVGSIRPVGSVAYKLLRVAAGADALTFSVRPKSEWDVCAGVGLILAAGGCYLRFDGRPVTFNQEEPRISSGAVAGPERLASPLLRRLIALRR